MPEQQSATVSYFIQSRPAPGQPWQRRGTPATWKARSEVLEELDYLRRNQPTWEHRLMERVTTITERPAAEDR
jgi:hypothetical protein